MWCMLEYMRLLTETNVEKYIILQEEKNKIRKTNLGQK